MAVDAIKLIYSSPDLKGEGFLTPVKRYHGFFIDQMKDSHPLYKGAMVIAHVASGIFVYPLLAIPAAVGMAVKTTSYVSACYTQAQDTIKVWKALSKALGRELMISDRGFFETFKVVRVFPTWMYRNKDQLDKIETLNLDYQYLTTLPDELGQLSNLKELFLTYNRFKTLPNVISTFSKLEHLRLTEALNFETLPNWIDQLTNLRFLNLSGGRNFRALPDSFRNLKKLEELYLGYCNITTIDAVFEFPKLRVLHLNSLSELGTLADKFDQLTELQNFELDGCGKVKSLPESLGHCKKLDYLSLRNQDFSTLPASLAELPAICNFSGTSWTCTPQAREKLLNDIAEVRKKNPALGPQVT